MKRLTDMSDKLLVHAHNPDAMAETLLEVLNDANDNEPIVLANPTDPVVALAEMATLMGHAIIESNRQMMPVFYPAMARNFDDLFRHMSDGDMLDVFAQPSETTITYLLDYDAIVAKALPLNGEGVRKLVIPRDSQVKVAGYVFTQQYPIEIRYLPYGTVQAVQAIEIKNPISPLPEKYLNSSLTTIPGTDIRVLQITVPVKQYSITAHYDSVVSGLGWSASYKYNNHFFYARVWMYKDGKWVELGTKYSKLGYDRNTPTAIIKVDSGTVNVSIPEVYINTGMVSGDVRVDIYDTLGPLNIRLGGYAVDDFVVNMRDFSEETPDAYYTPLKSFELFSAFSDTHVYGGRAQLPFAKLRERIVNNAIGPRSLPLSASQLVGDADRFGFTIEKAIDYVTNRIYLASADLPASTIEDVSSPIGTLSKPLVVDRVTLDNCTTVKQHGQRYTIFPDTVYTNDGSVFNIDVEVSNLHTRMRSRDLVALANQKNYYFSPFHYILDLNSGAVDARPYYIANPKITSRSFLNHNDTTELDVHTAEYTIEKITEGFRIQTKTKSEKPYQDLRDDQCFAQLSFNLTADKRTTAYLNGNIVGKDNGERIWEFVLRTDIDIDRNHQIILNNFFINDDETTPVPMPLDATVNLFYGTVDYYPRNYTRSTIDEAIIAPTRDAKGVTHETLTLLLGKSLTRLWASSRPLTGTINYQRYEEDIYKTYPTNVPKYEGKYPVYDVVTDETGKPDVKLVYEHRKGDIMLDEEGNKILQHAAGTIIYDENGKGVIANPRQVKYQFVLAAFDAKYLFSDARETKLYLLDVIDDIVNAVTVTLKNIEGQLIDETEIYYKVKSTIGLMEVLRDDGAKDFIPSDLKFGLQVYLTAANRRNTELIEKINAGIRRNIAEYLITHRTVSVSDIVETIKTNTVDAAITVEMDKMGPDEDLGMFTIVDNSAQANIAKRLEIAPDGSIIIKDNVTVTPTRHELPK